MKNPISLLLIFIFLISNACKESSENADKDTEDRSEEVEQSARATITLPRFPSPAAIVEQTIGLSTVTINYSRPNVVASNGVDRTGKIWGKQVPYDFDFRPAMGGGNPRPWRAGANENTTIEISHDAEIEGKPLKAGIYGLHVAIHQNSGATVIFSNTSNAWGSFSYEESEDALRVEVQTAEIPLAKRLIYTFTDVNKTSGTVTLDWEMKRIPFTVEFDTHNMVLGQFRDALADTTGISWVDYNRAASYCANNSVNLEQGMDWVDASIALETNYRNLSTKSKLLAGLGQSEQSMDVKNEALELPTTRPNDYYSYGTEFIRLGKVQQAMEIYQRLSKRWPDHWLTAHGLARAYSAMGDFEKAIGFENEALGKAPDANMGFIEGAIEKLESGQDFN